MAYRNELAAAQSRGNALEKELGALRQQLAENATSDSATAWSRLMDRGANEEERLRQAARRKQGKLAAAARRAAIADKRSALRAARWQSFDNRRRYLRSMTRWGRCAHWCAPLVLFSPVLFAFVAYFVVPASRSIFHSWALACAGLWGLSNGWAMFLASRENARLKALPFVVEGHHRTLGSNFRDLQVSLAFQGSAPTSLQMKRWLMGLATEVRGRALRRSIRNTRVELTNNLIVARPEQLVSAWMSGNRSYLVWYRQVVEKALVELHQTFPLARVEIDIVK